MTVIKYPVVRIIELTVDTDKFSFEQWCKFILDNVSPAAIVKITENDLFPLAKLKEKAIAGYQLRQEFLINE